MGGSRTTAISEGGSPLLGHEKRGHARRRDPNPASQGLVQVVWVWQTLSLEEIRNRTTLLALHPSNGDANGHY